MTKTTYHQNQQHKIIDLIEDGLSMHDACSLVNISEVTGRKRWKAEVRECQEKHGCEIEHRPHVAYKRAISSKLFLLDTLGYTQKEMAEIFNGTISQSTISRILRDEQPDGNSEIRISIPRQGLYTVDGEKEVPVASYCCVQSGNPNNAWLSPLLTGKGYYIVEMDQLKINHEVISPYMRVCICTK